jgi:hypothetical protein
MPLAMPLALHLHAFSMAFRVQFPEAEPSDLVSCIVFQTRHFYILYSGVSRNHVVAVRRINNYQTNALALFYIYFYIAKYRSGPRDRVPPGGDSIKHHGETLHGHGRMGHMRDAYTPLCIDD